jgi:RNA-dependent RNA polymerase
MLLARIGQAFTSTTPTIKIHKKNIQDIDDILKKNIQDIDENINFCFSDGVGFISNSFAEKISKEYLKLNFVPSLFQVRIGGIKGVHTFF